MGGQRMKKNEEKERRMQLRRGFGNRRVEVSTEWLRQSSTRYLVAHACFLCRKSFKLERSDTRVRACPDCGGQAYEMGRSFKAPARSDIKQWKKVQVLFAHGFRFFSYRTYECAPLPDRLSEVDEFIRAHPDHPFRVADPCPELLPDGQ
jgi:ribosomal protein L37AE/L43A